MVKCRYYPGNIIVGSVAMLFVVLLSLPLAGAITATDQQQLTTGFNQVAPAWSPDGKLIAYSSEQTIWIMNADGTGNTKIYDSIAWDGEPAFSATGEHLYFASEHVNPFSAKFISIHIIDIDRSNRTQITENADKRAPAVSPNGEKIAYLSKLSGNYDVWVMDIDGTNDTQITDSTTDEGAPSWSPNGKLVVYSLDGDIWNVGLRSKVPVLLKQNEFNNQDPIFSPDGEKIIFISDKDGSKDIWAMNADGTGMEQITFSDSDELDPAWSPDGNKLAYSSNEAGEFNIWTIELSDAEVPIVPEPDEIDDSVPEKIDIVKELEDFARSSPLRLLVAAFILGSIFVVLFVQKFMRGL